MTVGFCYDTTLIRDWWNWPAGLYPISGSKKIANGSSRVHTSAEPMAEKTQNVASLTTAFGWWFGTFGLFSIQLGISSSQLTFIFFRGVGQPPTR